MVHASSTEPLTTLNALDTVDISFTVPERNLQAVRGAADAHQAKVIVTETDAPANSHSATTAATRATATARAGAAAAAPDGTAIGGDLSFVDNTVDRTNGTLRLRARIDNKARVLWPGEFVTVNLVLGADADALVVPNVAIQQGPDGPYVFVVKSDLSVEQRPVQIARVADEATELSGVQAGERVVIDGQSRLTPGAHVAIRESSTAAGAAHISAPRRPGESRAAGT